MLCKKQKSLVYLTLQNFSSFIAHLHFLWYSDLKTKQEKIGEKYVKKSKKSTRESKRKIFI